MKQMVLSTEKLTKVFDSFLSGIQSIEDDTRRKAIGQMMNEIGERLLSAPASFKTTYHNCFRGGLAEHSLRVYKILDKLCDEYAPEIPNDTKIIVALFHDLGKIGDVNNDYYIPEDSTWHQEKLGQYYKINDEMTYMTHDVRSLFLLNHFNIDLTDDEYQAILIHAGQYNEENKPYKHKECMLAVLLHMADHLACSIERQKYKRFIGE